MSLEKSLDAHKNQVEELKRNLSDARRQLNLFKLQEKFLRNKISLLRKLPRTRRQNGDGMTKIFSESQIKFLNNSSRVKWTKKDISKSIGLVAVSKKAYDLIRNVWKYPLPCTRTLRKWVQNFKCEQGFLHSVFYVLAEQAKTLDNFSKVCILKFDEMSLNQKYSMDLSKDKIYSNHSKAQVIIAAGILKKWCQPIFYGFDKNMSKKILLSAIQQLENVGFFVCAVVSDMGGSNQGFLREMGISFESPNILHPFRLNSKIHFFADAPHLMKLLRNHILDQGIKLQDGTIIDKTLLESLISADSLELKLAHKLTSGILNVSGSERMKVSPAVKLLSAHTACLGKLVFPQNDSICTFFSLFDDYFDIFNSHVPKESAKKLKSGFGMEFFEQKDKLLQVYDTVKHMRVLQFSKKTNSLEPKKSLLPFQKGMLLSISSLCNLYNELKETYAITYLLTRRLNQDDLESIFSIIRSFGRTYDNPSSYEFKNRMKKLLLSSKLKVPSGANVSLEDSSVQFLCSELLTSVLDDEQVDPQIEGVASYDSNNDFEEYLENGYTKMALTHLAGYVGFVLKKKYNKCYGDISRNSEYIEDAEWTFSLSQGGLFIPNEELIETVKFCEQFFSTLSNDELINHENITDILCNRVLCTNNKFDKDVLWVFFRTRIKIRINFLNSNDTRLKSVKRVRVLCRK